MSEAGGMILGDGVIRVSADSTRLEAGIAQAKRSVRELGKEVGDSLAAGSAKAETAVSRLGKQIGDATAAGTSKASRQIDAYIKKIELASQTAGKSFAEVKLADFAERGATPDQLQRLSSAFQRNDAAAAQLDAEAQAAKRAAAAEQALANIRAAAQNAARSNFQSGQAFVKSLAAEVEASTKTRSELLALRAAKLGVTDQAAPFIAALRKEEAALGGVGKATKLLAFQRQQLGFQLHDFAVQVASGQSPLTAFIQQGSQLSGTFGGAGNAFKAVLGLLTPMRVAFIGGAAAAGVFALALSHAESKARDLATLQAQLAGTSRSGLFSTDELDKFLKRLALAPGVTRESATAIVSELSKARNVGGKLFRDLAGLAANYARATGTDIPAAAKALANAFADPERGAKQLDDALNGLLSSSEVLAIEGFVRTNDLAKAQAVLFGALERRVKGLADNSITPLQKSFNDLGNEWEKALDKLDKSKGLQSLNELLAKTVKAVAYLVEHADKIGGIGNIGLSMLPGGQAPAVANAIRAQFAGSPKEKSTGGASGTWEAVATAATAAGTAATAASAAVSGGPLGQEGIKRALELAKAYKGQAFEIAELTQQRKTFNDALKESIRLDGKAGSEVQARLRGAVAGVDEKIASVKKRGANNEPEQVRKAKLDADLKGFQDVLRQERDALAFHNRFVQAEYQAGTVSLHAFWADKQQTIGATVAAEIAVLDKEKARLEQDRKAVEKKDPSEALRLKTKIDEATAQQEKLRRDAANDAKVANLEEAQSFKALADQVANYRANLLQLQGDEVGAAKIRAQQTIEQAQLLASQSAPALKTPGDFARFDRGQTYSGVDVAGLQKALDENVALQKARIETSTITQRLQIQEERISLQQRAGILSENAALEAQGEARRKAVDDLEKIVKAQEEVAASRPKDYELQISTERARLELDKLKASLDPLKEKFDNLFKDAGASAINDLLSGTKGIKGALQGFAKSISASINSDLSKQLSESLFGKGGLLGGAGGLFAKVFGGKGTGVAENVTGFAGGTLGDLKIDAAKPTVDTSAVTQSLSSLQTAGIDPTITALEGLQKAVDATTGSLGDSGVTGDAEGLRAPGLTTGDFTRTDHGPVDTGEQSITNLFKEADAASARSARSTEAFGQTATSAATDLIKLAQSAGAGGNALSLLPSIIRAIEAASASSGSGSGGGLFGLLGSLFGGSGGGTITTGSGLEGMSSEALSFFFHDGGVVGKTSDMRPVNPGVFAGATKYHGGGMVGARAALAGLQSNEVPAILMGGPKGTREEVLHASDPRHSDNLAPSLLKVIQTGVGGGTTVLAALANANSSKPDEASPAGAVARMVHREKQTREMSPLTRYLIGSPSTVSSLITELSSESDFESVSALREIRVAGNRELTGPVSANSAYRVNERRPELLEVAGKQYLMTGNQGGKVTDAPQQKDLPPVTINFHFNGAEPSLATQRQLAAKVQRVLDGAGRNR